MKVLSKILWAIDFDADHTNSIEKVRRIAGAFGSEIILLHVLPGEVRGKGYQSSIEEATHWHLEKISEKISEGTQHQTRIRVEYGKVVESILAVAGREDVNMILLNKGKQFTLGKNGLAVYRRSKKPVIVVSDRTPAVKNHVVCPVDCSVPSQKTLKSAMVYARKMKAKLSVISVYEPLNIYSPRLSKMGLHEKHENEIKFAAFEKKIREFISQFDFSGLDVSVDILEGAPEQEIIKYSRNASILYVGSNGRTGLKRVIHGSVSEKVIREVSCNVAIIKTEEVFKLQIPAGQQAVEKHYLHGNELIDLGYVAEAVDQYKTGLKVNDLHLPSIEALQHAYDKLGNTEKALKYKDLYHLIHRQMMDRRVEWEIRRQYLTAV